MADKTAFKFLEANRVKMGSFTRDTGLASGNQVVSGLGFKPQAVIFFMCQGAAVGEASWGMDDGTDHKVVWDRHTAAANTWGTSGGAGDYSIFNYDAGAAGSYSGKINSMDSDGFTIAWLRGGNPAGTITINYIAYK